MREIRLLLNTMLQMIIKIISILVIVNFICCSTRNEEVKYYPSGKLHYKVRVKESLRHGKLVEYFESGEIKSYSNWANGELDGPSMIYYNNGNKKQYHNHKKGKRCCRSEFYLEDGTIKEVQIFDGDGNLYDYSKYKRNGHKDLSLFSRIPIFINERDTIKAGEKYRVLIRLGNREFNSIECILCDPNDKNILKNPKLPKIDITTCELVINDYHIGMNEIEGVLVEGDSSISGNMVVVPFSHKFHVTR